MSLKKIVFFGIIIASIFIMNSLIHSIYTLWQKNALMTQAQSELEKEKKENQMLKKKLSESKQKQFIEEEARNKLFLAKPGEDMLVIPSQYMHASSSASRKIVDTRPNWKRWLDVFF
jgi:cell division protein FtsB